MAWLKAAAIALAVLAAIAAVLATSFRRELSAARERIAASGARVVQTACGPIEYASRGEGSPLLAIHGAGGGFDQGLDLAGPFAEAGMRVIAVSRFGYLGTPLPADASAEAQARAHACLLDALGIPSVAVLGASAGATSAMQFAILYPERTTHLVLVVPAAYAPREDGSPPMKTPRWLAGLFDTALRWDFLFWALIRGAPGLATSSILGTPAALVERADEAEKARIARTLAHVLPVAPRRPGLLNDAAVTSTMPRYELERIEAPTLVLSARDDLYDTWAGADYSALHIPGARFAGYEEGGHLLVGHGKENLARIALFLSNGEGGIPRDESAAVDFRQPGATRAMVH